jgi:thiamine-phosphate pyrophosphorylase
LLAITDSGSFDERGLDENGTVRRARALLELVDPRLVAFGVRDHQASIRRRGTLARALIDVARPRGARVIVHDRVDLARVVEADGVQLGERSVDAASARMILGQEAWIGRSCHDEASLRQAAEEGVDAVTLSPLFPSPGKGAPLGVERFAALRATVPQLPVLALGGIDASNAERALEAGATGLAMIRAWLVGDLNRWKPMFSRLAIT